MKAWLVALAVAAGMTGMTGAHAASFNCAKASTFVEREICANPTLSHLDDALNADYQRMLYDFSNYPVEDPPEYEQFMATQRAWLKARNRCTTTQCLVDSYRKRVDVMCGQIDWQVKSDRAKCRGNGGLGGLDLDH
ncbi:lysozyme inhibitor LprI family protein [Burkholderia sp. BCC0322]|uniref:lysozyme inhibitor LprI family protein n=1 Tax=unclassified Burkholderia TaxID=2613784 RepID=UPI00158F531A|nr:lysozyme inhibitor LprI family protein [Burkholderia sp. BCC0322]